MELTFLGTSCMVPTKERNVTGIFLSYKTYGLLFDCGEGTQRQMNIAGINRNKVTHIFLSHWHGDHVSGLIGLIQTLGNQNTQNEEKKKIIIFGPKETEKRMEHLLQTCIFENKLIMEIHELNPKKGELLKIIDKEDFYIETTALDHGIPCIGYRFVEKDTRKIDMRKAMELGLTEGPLIGKIQKGVDVEINGKKITPEMVSTIKKGKKIGIVLDTGLCRGASLIAEDADLLICEASYASAIEEKAENNKHLTAKQAALLAANSNAKKTNINTYFSKI
ncbi:MAG: ribonuclease Z [Candidatus Woesearchaeota archaeon]|nr:MAG: ribonuclease Z [Candidatus Woesearchaeota archaeon]